MRRGFTSLSGLVQTVLEQNPLGGHVYVFRGRRGDLIKLLWHEGDGFCLFQKRLDTADDSYGHRLRVEPSH